MTAAAAPGVASRSLGISRRWLALLAVAAGVAVFQVLGDSMSTIEGSDRLFPALWDKTFEDPIQDAGAWLRSNRLTHPIFTGLLTPFSKTVGGAIDAIADALLWLPWFVVLGIVVLIPARAGAWKAGVVGAIALFYTVLIGLWVPTMQTLALMSAAVLLAAIVGLPLGMVAALYPRFEQVLRPVLDAAQTLPAFVYFLPLLMLFGIGNVPGAVATVIYALPPVVRLTTLGIKRVPQAAVDASLMFGATKRQTLLKVQVPMAVPTIITGLTQTIMLSLGVVVLATLVGADGLGSPILQTLNSRRTGRGIAAGLAIVAVAMVLDRMWKSFAVTDRTKFLQRRYLGYGVGGLLIATLAGRAFGIAAAPDLFDWSLFDPIDDGVVWTRDNLRWFTRPFSDWIVLYLYLPARDFLTDTMAWPSILLMVGAACWWVRGRALAVFSVAALGVIGLIGMWELSIDTLVQVIIAAGLATVIAVPLGLLVGRSKRVEALMGPVLDGLQTVPSLVYIVPAVIFFTVGVVPGIIATVLYAMVPGVRITALGIREVPEESIEASRTFGATPRQTMLGVRVPLAAPTIMAGINQVIMLSLAMVIISGLVGGGALGFETVRSLKRSLFGFGFEVGVALVLMAMLLDRFTEACAQRLQPPE
ncbi:MAG: ABC transporter permease subunit [Acidimicrobiales bacterium]|nr:ABC transporter permease subunit [Acidimicrobiales bacterium]